MTSYDAVIEADASCERRTIAWLALGYFGAYLLYSLTTKALSLDVALAGQAVPGLALLPGVIVGASAVVLLAVVASSQWRRVAEEFRHAAGAPIPWGAVALSGFGTAAIVATTTLAYGFPGVSIVLALVMMRGGVLVMSPLLDGIFHRRIHWYSGAGLGLALLAVSLTLLQTREGVITDYVLANLLVYLGGYAVRLVVINRYTKTRVRLNAARYFVAEQAVCYPILLVGIAAFGLIVGGEAGAAVRGGWQALFAGDGWGTILAGAMYGCLFVFGTLIYLDWRENTFCIALNRSTSLMAGIVASVLLAAIVPSAPLRPAELVGAGLLGGALITLLVPVFREARAGNDG